MPRSIRSCIVVIAVIAWTPWAHTKGSSSNWLLGGRWVIFTLQCTLQNAGTDIRPQGIEFFKSGMLVRAPSIARGGSNVTYDASYELNGADIVSHLHAASNGNRLDLSFHKLDPNLIRDMNGYMYRRCSDPKAFGPTS